MSEHIRFPIRPPACLYPRSASSRRRTDDFQGDKTEVQWLRPRPLYRLSPRLPQSERRLPQNICLGPVGKPALPEKGVEGEARLPAEGGQDSPSFRPVRSATPFIEQGPRKGLALV